MKSNRDKEGGEAEGDFSPGYLGEKTKNLSFQNLETESWAVWGL